MGEETRQIIERATITNCVLCNRTHDDIKLRRYNEQGTAKPHPFYTHYYCCPINGDPVGMTIKTDPTIAIDTEVLSQLIEMQKCGRWMIAMWGIGRRAFFKTYCFPPSSFGESCREHRRWITEVTSGPEAKELDEADVGDETLFPKISGQQKGE